jgi:hypothetical protein
MNSSVLDWLDVSEEVKEERTQEMIKFRSLNQTRVEVRNSDALDLINPNTINILVESGFAWRFVYPTLTFINNWKGYKDIQLYTLVSPDSKNFEMIHRINSFYQSYLNRDIIIILPKPTGDIKQDIPISYKKIFDKMDHYLVFAVVFLWVGKQKKIYDYFRSKGKRTMYIGFDDLVPNNQQSFIRYSDVAVTVNCQESQDPLDHILTLNKNSYYHPHTVDFDMFTPMEKVWDFKFLHSFEPHRIVKKNKRGQLIEHKLGDKETKEIKKKALTSTDFYRDYRIVKTIFKLSGNNIRGGHNWDQFPITVGDNWTFLDDYIRSGIYNSADWTNTMNLFGKSKYTINLFRKIHRNAYYIYTERPLFSFASGCILFADELGNNEFLSQHNINWGDNIFRLTHETTVQDVNDMLEDIKSNYNAIINKNEKIGKWWDYRNWMKRFREIMFEADVGDSFENPPIKNP